MVTPIVREIPRSPSREPCAEVDRAMCCPDCYTLAFMSRAAALVDKRYACPRCTATMVLRVELVSARASV